jgi:signal transduction histidine kinase
MISKYPEASISLTESEWINNESIRRVMLRSKVWAYAVVPSYVFTAAMAYGYINITWILTWITWMLGFFSYVVHLKINHANPNFALTPQKPKRYIEHLGYSWFLLGLGWSTSGLVFYSALPAQQQFMVAVALSFNVLLTVLDLCRHQRVAKSFINGMFGGLWVGSAWFIGVIKHFNASEMDYVYLLAALVAWYFAYLFNNQLYRAFCRDLKLQHHNFQLINDLRQETTQLALEKKSALVANETIKRFFSSAAHDIRQPVYALNMYAAFLKDAPENAADLIPKITSSCRGINALFESLFEYEKIKSNQVIVTVEKIDLTSFVNDMVSVFKPLATSKKLFFRVKPLTGHLLVDSLLLKGILGNFITNAIKYTPTGGLLFAVRKFRNGISFEVWDTGIGIDETHHEHIFDEFYKVGEHSSADEGFGLGLSVAKRLATHIDGYSLSIRSRIGRGSVFKLHVPLTDYPHLNREESAKSHPGTQALL